MLNMSLVTFSGVVCAITAKIQRIEGFNGEEAGGVSLKNIKQGAAGVEKVLLRQQSKTTLKCLHEPRRALCRPKSSTVHISI